MDQKFDIDPRLIDELAKSIKTEKDLAALSKHLLKLTVERAMDVELENILATKSMLPKAKTQATAVMVTHPSR